MRDAREWAKDCPPAYDEPEVTKFIAAIQSDASRSAARSERERAAYPESQRNVLRLARASLELCRRVVGRAGGAACGQERYQVELAGWEIQAIKAAIRHALTLPDSSAPGKAEGETL